MAKRQRGFKSSQTGTPNSKNYSKGSGRISRIMNPWGTPFGKKSKGSIGKVSGSSTRMARPAPEQRGMQYPANQPWAWPVVPDEIGHTAAPDPFGITAQVRTNVNASIEHAYTRAGYQNSP